MRLGKDATSDSAGASSTPEHVTPASPQSAPMTRRELRLARIALASSTATKQLPVVQQSDHLATAVTDVKPPKSIKSLRMDPTPTQGERRSTSRVSAPVFKKSFTGDAPQISEVVERPVSAKAASVRTRSRVAPATLRAVRKVRERATTPKRRTNIIDHTQSIKIHPEPVLTDPVHAKRGAALRLALPKRLSVLMVAAGIVLTGAVPSYAVDPVVAASSKAGTPIDAASLRAGQQQAADASAKSQSFAVSDKTFATDDDTLENLDRDSADVQLPVNLNEPRSSTACQVPDPTGKDVDSETVVPVPIGSFNLTSEVGQRWGRWHNGQDFAADKGTSIVAAHSGTVVGVGFWGINPYVSIKSDVFEDGKQYGTVYEHMPTSTITVAVGDRVRAGQQIAEVGNEGQSTGAHLHFEVHDITGKADEKFLGVKSHIQPVDWLRQYTALGLSGC